MALTGSAAAAARSAAHPSPAPLGGQTCAGGWGPPGGQRRTPVRQGGAGEEGSGAEQAAERRSRSPQRGTGGGTVSRLVSPARSRLLLAGEGRWRAAALLEGGCWGTGGETRPAATGEVRGDARGAAEAGPLQAGRGAAAGRLQPSPSAGEESGAAGRKGRGWGCCRAAPAGVSASLPVPGVRGSAGVCVLAVGCVRSLPEPGAEPRGGGTSPPSSTELWS